MEIRSRVTQTGLERPMLSWSSCLHLRNARTIGTELISCILVRVSFPMIKHHDQKQLGEESVFIIIHFQVTVPHWRNLGQELKQGRNQEAGTDAEAMEGCFFMTLSPGLAQPAFHTPHDHLRRAFCGPTQITKLGNVLQSCPQAKLTDAFSQLSDGGSPSVYMLLIGW